MNAVTLALAILVVAQQPPIGQSGGKPGIAQQAQPVEKAVDVKDRFFVVSSSLHPKGKGVAMASHEKIVVTDEKGAEVFSLSLPALGGSPYLKFSSDGSHLVVKAGDSVTVYDTGKYRKVFTSAYVSNCPPSLSSDGKRVALAPIMFHGREVYVYDGPKLTQTLPLGRFESARTTVFSADGKQLLMVVDAISTVNVQLWNIAEEKLLWKTELKGVRHDPAIFSPDGQSVVTCTAHGALTMLSAKDGKVLHDKQVFDFEKPKLFILDHSVFGDDGSLVVCYTRQHWVPARARLFQDLPIRRDRFGFGRDFQWDNDEDLQFDGYTIQLWQIKDGKATLKKASDPPMDVTDVKTEKDGTVTYVSRGEKASVQKIPQK